MRENGHIGYVGTTGSGKTSLMLRHLLAETDRGWDCSSGIAAFLPHPDEGHKLILHLLDRGHGGRLLVRDMARTDVVLPTTLIRRSDDPDYWTRRRMNNLYRDAFLELAWRRRGEEVRLAERPTMERAGKAVVDVYQALDGWLSPAELPNILVQGHPVQAWALAHCASEEARASLRRLADMNSHEQVAQVLPTERWLYSFLDHAPIQAMVSVPPTVEPTDWVRRGGIYICLGGGGREAIKTLMGAEAGQFYADALESPCETPRYLYMDEVVNYDLIGRMEAEALATVRFRNLFLRFAVQQYGEDKAVWTPIRQNLNGKYFGRQADPEMAMEAARDLVAKTDRMKIHHTEEVQRQVHLGFRQEERVSRGGWSDGDKSGTSHTTSLQNVPEYGQHTEVRTSYESPNDQLFWLARELRTLPDMHYYRLFKNEPPTTGVVKWLPKLCAFDQDFSEEVERTLAMLMSNTAIYKPPATPTPLTVQETKARTKPKGLR